MWSALNKSARCLPLKLRFTTWNVGSFPPLLSLDGSSLRTLSLGPLAARSHKHVLRNPSCMFRLARNIVQLWWRLKCEMRPRISQFMPIGWAHAWESTRNLGIQTRLKAGKRMMCAQGNQNPPLNCLWIAVTQFASYCKSICRRVMESSSHSPVNNPFLSERILHVKNMGESTPATFRWCK